MLTYRTAEAEGQGHDDESVEGKVEPEMAKGAVDRIVALLQQVVESSIDRSHRKKLET